MILAATSTPHTTSSGPPLWAAQRVSHENFGFDKVAGKTRDAGEKHSVDTMAGKEKIRYISISIHCYRKGSYFAGPLPSRTENHSRQRGRLRKTALGMAPAWTVKHQSNVRVPSNGTSNGDCRRGIDTRGVPRTSAYAPSPSVGNLTPQPFCKAPPIARRRGVAQAFVGHDTKRRRDKIRRADIMRVDMPRGRK